MDFLYYVGGGEEWGGELRKKIRNLSLFCLPLILLKNLIPSNLQLIALVSHAFSGVLMHLLDF